MAAHIVLLKDVPLHIPGVSIHFLRCGFNSGRLPGFRIGNLKSGRVAFDLDILEAHIKQMALQNIKPIDDTETNNYGKLRKVK